MKRWYLNVSDDATGSHEDERTRQWRRRCHIAAFSGRKSVEKLRDYSLQKQPFGEVMHIVRLQCSPILVVDVELSSWIQAS